MKKYFIILAVLGFTFGCGPQSKTKEVGKITAQKPNILFIAVDDLNTTLGCYGNKQIKSPQIDKLATQGTVFRNNHCQQALCGPSRASVLSGLRPDDGNIWELFTQVREANPQMVSLPEHLRRFGYETAGSGKVYDGSTVDSLRDDLSWSIPFVKPKGTRWLVHNKTNRFGGASNEHKKNVPFEAPDQPESDFLDAKIVDEGLLLMKQMAAGNKPFFLAVGIKKPHLPFVAPKKYWDLYKREDIKIAEVQEFPQSIPAWHFQPSWELRSGYAPVPNTNKPLPVDMQKELKHGYYACISHADNQVGRLLKELDALGIRDNTIVVLWGDHGYHLGDHMMWNKFTDLEISTSTPLIISAPNFKANNVTVSPSELVDIYPTLCDLVGVENPYKMGGASLVPILKDGTAKVKNFSMTQYHRTNRDGVELMGYSIRTVHFRYTEWVKDMFKNKDSKYAKEQVLAAEFYDYQKDPLERKNLIDDKKYQKQIEIMKGYMLEYFTSQNRLAHK